MRRGVSLGYADVPSLPERTAPRRWTFYIGKDGEVLYVDKSVKPGTHGADVAAKLAELGIPERD